MKKTPWIVRLVQIVAFTICAFRLSDRFFLYAFLF